MESIVKDFEQIYHLTYNKVLYYILAKCGKVPEVEDILQETYAELYQVLTEKGSAYITVPEGFVMQLAKSKVYRYYSEKEWVQAKAFVETAEVVAGEDINETVYHNRDEEWEDALLDKLTANEIMEYLSQKDELTREIFYQHYFQDKTLKEIAESSGMKETTIKKRLYRTLKELKGMKRFLILAVILLLTVILAKPVYSWAEDMIAQIKRYLTEDTKDTLEIIELGRAYKLYMDGKVPKESSININGEDYSFNEIEQNWENNPWLEELDWSDIQ